MPSAPTRLITVTADPKSKVYGDADPPPTCQVISGSLVNGDGLSGTLTRTVGENPGAYAIQRGTLAAGGNDDLTFVSADPTITPTDSTTALDSPPNPSGQGSNATFAATVIPLAPASATPTGSGQYYTNGVAAGSPAALSRPVVASLMKSRRDGEGILTLKTHGGPISYQRRRAIAGGAGRARPSSGC